MALVDDFILTIVEKARVWDMNVSKECIYPSNL